MTDLPRGNLKKKVFFPTFQGLNSISELSDSESPDCDNWIPYNSELQKHGPRLASKSLLTTPYAAPVRLIKKWIGKGGAVNELHVIDGYNVIYPNDTPALTNVTTAVTINCGILVDHGEALAAGARYYSSTADLGGGHWFSTPAPTNFMGYQIGTTFFADYSEYGHVDMPALTFVLGASAAPLPVVEYGYRIGVSGVDVSLGSWNLAAGNPHTINIPAAPASGVAIGYYSEMFLWILPTVNPHQFNAVQPAASMSSLAANMVYKV